MASFSLRADSRYLKLLFLCPSAVGTLFSLSVNRCTISICHSFFTIGSEKLEITMLWCVRSAHAMNSIGIDVYVCIGVALLVQLLPLKQCQIVKNTGFTPLCTSYQNRLIAS